MKRSSIKEEVISGGQTQDQIESNKKRIADRYPEVFEGLGRAKVNPIHITVDNSVKPLQQKQRRIA